MVTLCRLCYLLFLMEYLTRMFQAAAKDPQFRFHPLCKRHNMVCLMFADDLLVFCKSHEFSVPKLTNVLERFGRIAGQMANHTKSNIYMGGLSVARQARLLALTGFQRGNFPMRYLGLPLSTSSWSKQDCKSLTDKVTSGIHSWSSRNLSFAGRLQLIRSVLHTFHIYWASVFYS